MKSSMLLLVVISLNCMAADESLCRKDESVAYSCQLENKKSVSVCVDGTHVVYKYGTEKNIELKMSSEKYTFIPKYDLYPKGEERSYKFLNGLYSYNVFLKFFSHRGDDGDSYTDEDYGVSVLKNNREIFHQSCVDLPDINPELIDRLIQN